MQDNMEILIKEKEVRKDRIFLEWSNINYSITLKKTKSAKVAPDLSTLDANKFANDLSNTPSENETIVDPNQRVILKNVEGFALPNELLAIMGPSGCGKTSLLNIIACRQLGEDSNQKITREVKANDLHMDGSNFGKICAYIMQDDILMDTLTPRESLYFGAKLKLKKSEAEIRKRVENLIIQFGLTKCADSRIGNVESKGISGGERKRTSIAYEIISDPPIIIIDEPTTGMDSFTSLVIVKYLKSLASTGKTIVCTIHQPSSEIFHYIDRLVLLKDGHLVYQGKSEWALKYFTEINMPMPAFCNPFDFFLDILSDSNHTHKELNSHYLKLCEQEVIEEKVKYHKEYQNQEIYTIKQNLRQVGWCLEFWLLLKRACVDYFRNKILFFTRFLNALFNTLIIMGFYWNMGAEEKQGQLFQNYVGFFFNNVNQFFINGIYTSIFMIPKIKVVLKREYSAKLYRISTFYLTTAISLLINAVVFSVLFTPFTFFGNNMIMKTTADNVSVFVVYFVINFFMFSLGTFFGLTISGSLPETVSHVVAPFVFITCMLGAGLYRGNGSLPSFISWFFYISPYKYFLEIAMKNFMHFNQITELIPEQMEFNFGMGVCLPTLFGIMVTAMLLGFVGIKKFASKF